MPIVWSLYGITPIHWLFRSSKGSNSETRPKNHVWDSQIRAIIRRRTPKSLTLHKTARLIVGNAYSLRSSHGWAKASIPSGARWHREKNQRGHWIYSCDVKRYTSVLLKRSKIWATIQFPDLSFCLDSKSAERFRAPGTWGTLSKRSMSWAQRRRQHACLYLAGLCETLPQVFCSDNHMTTHQYWAEMH